MKCAYDPQGLLMIAKKILAGFLAGAFLFTSSIGFTEEDALAPSLRSKAGEYREKFIAGKVLLSHKRNNEYIEKKINEIGYEDLLKKLVSIKGVEGKVELIAIPGLLKFTGLLAHVGLGRHYRKPVIYIDEALFCNEDIRQHEADEVASWEALRNSLKRTPQTMRDWVLDKIDAFAVDEGLPPKYRNKTSREIAEIIHTNAHPIPRTLYEQYADEIDYEYLANLTIYDDQEPTEYKKDVTVAAHGMPEPSQFNKNDLEMKIYESFGIWWRGIKINYSINMPDYLKDPSSASSKALWVLYAILPHMVMNAHDSFIPVVEDGEVFAGEVLRISIKITADCEGGLRLVIEDNGCGIAVMEQLFELPITTKPSDDDYNNDKPYIGGGGAGMKETGYELASASLDGAVRVFVETKMTGKIGTQKEIVYKNGKAEEPQMNTCNKRERGTRLQIDIKMSGRIWLKNTEYRFDVWTFKIPNFIDARAGKGSLADCLAAIKDNPDLFKDALAKDTGIKISDVMKLRKYDPSTVYKEFKALGKLGILIPVEGRRGYVRFSDMMIGPDANYTKTLINAICDMRYQIGQKGDIRPLHRGSLVAKSKMRRGELIDYTDMVKGLVKMTILHQINILQKPAIPGGKVLWHLLEQDLVSASQGSSFVQEVNNVAKNSSAAERIYILRKGELIEDAMDAIKREHPDAVFDVALSNETHIEKIKDNTIKRLVFKGKAGDVAQLEGFVAALRALHNPHRDEIIPTLKRIYAALNGSAFAQVISQDMLDDPVRFAHAFIFDLPPAEAIPPDEVSKMNERLLQLLVAA